MNSNSDARGNRQEAHHFSRQARLAWCGGPALLLIMVPAGLFRDWFTLVWDWSALRFLMLVVLGVLAQFAAADHLPDRVVIASGGVGWLLVFVFGVYLGFTL